MYLPKVTIKPSGIEGQGVFADEDITKDTLVWKYDPGHDQAISMQEYDALNNEAKADIRKVGYVSSTTGKWVYPPKDDPARFTNHSETDNNLTAKFNSHVSGEPFFVAKRNITAGEELTVNYVEFDASVKQGRPEWMQS